MAFLVDGKGIQKKKILQAVLSNGNVQVINPNCTGKSG